MNRAANTRIIWPFALFLAGAVLGVIAAAPDGSAHVRELLGGIGLLLLIASLLLGFQRLRGRGQPPDGGFWGGGPPDGGHGGGGGGHG